MNPNNLKPKTYKQGWQERQKEVDYLKSAADKLAEALEKVLDHVQPQKILINHTEVRSFVTQALKEYRGEE